jgi:hypothetical protein
MDLKVFITNGKSICSECGEDLGRHAWIALIEDKGVLCLACADLDHLILLPSGDAALTRRAGKYSTPSAVVLQWSRARKRYERQGLLVEEAALQRAEQECLADEDVRIRRREREAEQRAVLDRGYMMLFAARVGELFPHCPAGREQVTAEHACQKYSGSGQEFQTGLHQPQNHQLPVFQPELGPCRIVDHARFLSGKLFPEVQ